jgi:predicted O-methyltransferase YrrM
MSYERLALALLHGHQYYGPALRSLQGVTDRHRCMEPVVRAAIEGRGERPLQILEIGSWAGASAVSWAVALKSLSPGGRLTCLDTWKPYFDPEVDREAIYAEMNAAARRGDVLPLFLHNIRSAGVADIVEYRVGASSDVLPQMEPGSFDIIYIDGSHAFADVLGDLSQAVRLIRDEGIVCGDDLELQRDAIEPAEHTAAVNTGRDFVWAESARSHYHPGVTEAVARLLGPVFSWNGFWAARRRRSQWEWLEVSPGALPSHIADAVSASDRYAGTKAQAHRSSRRRPSSMS